MLASLFIIMTIIIIVSPYVVSTKKNEIIRVTNSIVTELKVIKTLAISKNSYIYVDFSKLENKGYTYFEYKSMGKKYGEYSVPKGYVIDVSKADFDNGKLAFRPDGTLGHRATTIRIMEVATQREEKITLTIGYTRIMRVD
ncbi:MAG: hypothetical protein RR515_03920 [Clostridium sp.]